MKILEIITEIETARSVTDMEKEIIQDISHRGGDIHPYYRRLDTYRAAEIAFGLFKGTVSQHQAISGALKQLGFKDPSTVMDNPEYDNKVGGFDDTEKDTGKTKQTKQVGYQPKTDSYSDKFRGNQYVKFGKDKLPTSVRAFVPDLSKGIGTAATSGFSAGKNLSKLFDPANIKAKGPKNI
jgi:hypothetical protein